MKKGFFQVGIAIVFASVFVAGLLVSKLNFSYPKADSCNSYSDSLSCNKACSPVKADGVSSYKCKWLSATSRCVESANKCDAPITHFGDCSDITGSVNVYYCQGMMSAQGSIGCSKTDPLPAGAGWDSVNKKIVGSFCGTIQVDERVGGDSTGNFCSLIDSSGCKTDSPPVITPSPTPKPTPSKSPSPTPTPTKSPSPTPTKSPSPTPAGVCKITFVPADHKAVCWKDARDFTVTYKVESLPSNGVYYMQTDWYVASPTVGPNHYNESQRIYAGQTYTFTAHWPGVSGNPSNVDVQLGLNVVDANHNLITPNCSKGLDYYWTPYVCKFTPTPSPTPTATPVPKCNSTCSSDSQCPSGLTCYKKYGIGTGYCRNVSCTKNSNCVCTSPTPTPTKSPSPTPTISPTPKPEISKLTVCKYRDENGNGYKDSEDKLISWEFNYNDGDVIKNINSYSWNVFRKGCVTVKTQNDKTITVNEEGRSGWELTGIYADNAKQTGGNYIYKTEAGKNKEVWFLNKVNPESTPTVGEPNSCNGTCGSNSNCKSGLFCYEGYCRIPENPKSSTCATPTVLSATAPPELPKTGNNIWLNLAGFVTLATSGIFIYKKFRLI